MGGKQRPIGVVILAILTDLAGILGLIVATVLGILAGEMEELI